MKTRTSCATALTIAVNLAVLASAAGAQGTLNTKEGITPAHRTNPGQEAASGSMPVKNMKGKTAKPVVKAGQFAASAKNPDSSKGTKNANNANLKQGTPEFKREQSEDAVQDALAEVDGIKKEKPQAEKKGFTIGDLNPFKWIFKPITDIHKEVRNLGAQVNGLNSPLSNMQKPMVGLRGDLVEVSDDMRVLRKDIGNVHDSMVTVEDRITNIDNSLVKLAKPVGELATPVRALHGPVKKVDGQLKSLGSDLHEMKDTITFTTEAIFVAILGVGFLIVVGTPIAALFVIKHRTAILAKLGAKGEHPDDLPKSKVDQNRMAGAGRD